MALTSPEASREGGEKVLGNFDEEVLGAIDASFVRDRPRWDEGKKRGRDQQHHRLFHPFSFLFLLI